MTDSASPSNQPNNMNPRRLLPLGFIAVILLCLIAVFNPFGSSSSSSSSMSSGAQNVAGLSVFPRIALFGDSLTARIVRPESNQLHARLAKYCDRQCDVVVRGFSGYNTTSAKVIAPALFPHGAGRDVHFMTVLFGTNDVSKEEILHVDLTQYKENLVDLLLHLLDEFGVREDRLLLLCPPPVNDQASETRKNAAVREYAAECEAIGKKLKVKVLNLYTHFQAKDSTEYLLPDGFHLSAKGYEDLWELIFPLLPPAKVILPMVSDPAFVEVLHREVTSKL